MDVLNCYRGNARNLSGRARGNAGRGTGRGDSLGSCAGGGVGCDGRVGSGGCDFGGALRIKKQTWARLFLPLSRRRGAVVFFRRAGLTE